MIIRVQNVLCVCGFRQLSTVYTYAVSDSKSFIGDHVSIQVVLFFFQFYSFINNLLYKNVVDSVHFWRSSDRAFSLDTSLHLAMLYFPIPILLLEAQRSCTSLQSLHLQT